MAHIIVQINGKKYKATATAMQPLSVIVEQVAAQLKPQPNPTDCTLLYNKQPLDLSIPLRLANLPAPIKLDMTAPGQTSTLGIRANTSQPQPNMGSGSVGIPMAANQQKESSNSQQFQTLLEGVAQQQPHVAPSSQTSTVQPLASTMGQPAYLPQPKQAPGPLTGTSTAHAQPATHLPGPSFPAAASQIGNGTMDVRPSKAEAGPSSNSSKAAGKSEATVPERFAALGLSREVAIFTRQDLEATSAGISQDDLPPEFYEFGLEDYVRVQQSISRAAKHAEAGLRTAKLREQEERQKASRFPECTLRILFPDGMIMQALFGSLEELAAVRELVQQCLAPGLRKWYIYTTPPKQVIKDYECTLYRAGLAPAANLHLGIEGDSMGPFLRADILELRSAPPKPDIKQQSDGDTQQSTGIRRGEHEIAGGSHFKSSSKAAQEVKLPKWMKVKK